MKLTLGKKDVAYSSLEMESPVLRRSGSSSSSGSLAHVHLDSPVGSSSSAATAADSELSDGYFGQHGGHYGAQGAAGFHSAARDVIAALERPVRRLAFEIKGALLATGCVRTVEAKVGME